MSHKSLLIYTEKVDQRHAEIMSAIKRVVNKIEAMTPKKRPHDELIKQNEALKITGLSWYEFKKLVQFGEIQEIRIGNSHPKYKYSEVVKFKK